jgi:hypothetical protein
MVEVPFNHEWVGMLEQEQHALRYREEEWRTLFPGKHLMLTVSTQNLTNVHGHHR